MSTYNESDKGEWVYNHVYTLIKEIAKGPKSYKEYSQDTVKKVLNELAEVLAVEKRNGIRLLGFKPDTIM